VLAEEACDGAVLEAGYDAAEYAEYLLDMERSVKAVGARVPVLGVAMPGTGLPRRIRLIFDGPRWPLMSKTKIACMFLACAATAVVFGAGTLEQIPALQLPPVRLIEVPPAGFDAIPAPPRSPNSATVLLAQTQQAPRAPAEVKHKFSVASVRPCQAGDGADKSGRGGGGGRGFGSSPGRFWITCLSVREMVDIAYRQFASDPLQNDLSTPMAVGRISGGPGWMRSDYYTVNAETNDPIAATGPTTRRSPAGMMMAGEMLQSLLEDRFQLKIHRETEEAPLYALTIAKGGLKLKPMQKDGCTPHEPGTPLVASNLFPPGQKPMCISRVDGNAANWKADAAGQSLKNLAGWLSRVTDRPVEDRTGVTELFEWHLTFAHDDDAPGSLPEGMSVPFPASDDPVGGSIFTALGEVGLKLEAIKGPRGFLVIDSVERPSEN
jgi:uncharacterized protein (TIGR03435 family)